MPSYVQNLYFATDTQPGHVDTMRHSAWELIYIVKGEVRAEIAGKSYTVKAPAFIFVSHYEPHYLTVLSDEYERYVMMLDPSVAKSEFRPAFLQTVFSLHSPSFCHVLPINESEGEFRMLMENLMAEHNETSGDGEGELIWLSAILWKAYRMAPTLFSVVGETAERIVASIRTELEAHPEKKLNLKALATSHFISPYYLSHVFHRVTGYSIKRYLLLCRISLACTLLSEGNQTVAQVAGSCGFADTSNFSRYFREITGMTPWEYRKLGSGRT